MNEDFSYSAPEENMLLVNLWFENAGFNKFMDARARAMNG
jgi:hypothetical protein